jgi:hypothetical protein
MKDPREEGALESPPAGALRTFVVCRVPITTMSEFDATNGLPDASDPDASRLPDPAPAGGRETGRHGERTPRARTRLRRPRHGDRRRRACPLVAPRTTLRLNGRFRGGWERCDRPRRGPVS